MASQPPRPPIICYDLHSNSNIRRQRPPMPKQATTTDKRTDYRCTCKNDVTPTFISANETRFAYDQAIRQRVEDQARVKERERHRSKLIMEIDRIKNDLSVVKQGVDEAPEMMGMSHKTAQYVENMLQEIVALRRQFNLYTENRSKEVERKTLMLKQRERELDMEARRLRNLPNNQTQNSDNMSNNSSSISSQSSTSSISSPQSFSTPIIKSKTTPKMTTSTASRGARSIRFDDNVTINLDTDSSVSSLSPPNQSNRLGNSYLDRFSFYKGRPEGENSTLEITDLEFFDKLEDKTMMEVQGLVNRMQSVLKEVENEKISFQ